MSVNGYWEWLQGLASVQKELAPTIASHVFVINAPGGKQPLGPLLSWFEDVEQTHALESQMVYTYTGRIGRYMAPTPLTVQHSPFNSRTYRDINAVQSWER